MAIKKALVVDDSRVARFTLAKLLKTRGIEVDMADSGAQAIEYLQSVQPDVVFMDFMMPEMNGLEATQAITGNPATSSVPVVFCTGNDTPEDRKQAMDHGASSFLTKSGGEQEIDSVLSSLSQQTAKTPEACNAPVIDHGNVLDVDELIRQAVARAREEASATARSEVQALLGNGAHQADNHSDLAAELRTEVQSRVSEAENRLRGGMREAAETALSTRPMVDEHARARLTAVEQRITGAEGAARAAEETARKTAAEAAAELGRELRKEVSAMDRRVHESLERENAVHQKKDSDVEEIAQAIVSAKVEELIEAERTKLTKFAVRTAEEKAEEVTSRVVEVVASRVAEKKAHEVAISAAEEVTFNTVETAREVSMEEMREFRDSLLKMMNERIDQVMTGDALRDAVADTARSEGDTAGGQIAERVAEHVAGKVVRDAMSKQATIAESRAKGLYRRTVSLSVGVLLLAVITNAVNYFL